jgi:hypothetical protein
VRDGGYALAGAHPPAVSAGSRWARVSRPDGLSSVMLALHGFGAAAVTRAVDANALGVCSATPYLTATRHPGGSALYVSLVVLTGDRVDPAALRRSVAVGIDGDRVTVRFPDGERVELGLGATVTYARRSPDGGTPSAWP